MSVLRRRLLMGGGRWRYVDEFAALSSRWVAQAGSLAVSGGALQAATLGDWLGNLVANGEFTINTAGWGTTKAMTLARVDSEADPGVNSGGIDKWVLKSIAGNISFPNSRTAVAVVLHGIYRLAAQVYRPTGSSGRLSVANLGVEGSTFDAWESLEVIDRITSGGAQWLELWMSESAPSVTGKVNYGDAVVLFQRNAPALLNGWSNPNHIVTLNHVSPAANWYIPFGYICRYTDSLNYWEVRVLPNTAANDLQIIQVTAGAQTTRAEADVDWTAGGTDELMVRCHGDTISTYYRKSGAAVWTAGPSYANATQGRTSPQLGVLLYETGVGRLSRMEVREA